MAGHVGRREHLDLAQQSREREGIRFAIEGIDGEGVGHQAQPSHSWC